MLKSSVRSVIPVPRGPVDLSALTKSYSKQGDSNPQIGSAGRLADHRLWVGICRHE